MSDGFEIWTNRWIPDENTEIKAVIQLHHGLAEHSLRYDRLGSILAENGYVLNAYDFRGHGKTAENAKQKGTGDFGVLADKDGFNRVIEDLNENIENLKKEYPGKKVILLGHSFGSFISQGYIEKYSKNISGCILCGTAGPSPVLHSIAKATVKLICLFKNPRKVSPFVIHLSFDSYNKRVPNAKTPNDWISANQANIDMYNQDKWCGFPLPLCFFRDMTCGLKQIHNPANIKKISNDLPIFFIYGTEDPVGAYGKTINNLFNIYKKNGVKSLEIKGYEGDRHELFNEDDKENVEKDVLSWIEKIVG